MPANTILSSDETLQKIKERFELIAQATNDTIWDWDLRTDDIWWNENFQTMFGFSAEQIEPDIRSWYNRIHPDDKDRVVKGIHDVIDHGGKNWSDEYRFLRADGSYAVVYDRGYTLHDEKGPYRMVGSMQDITERKYAQEKLTESEERLRIAIESAELGTWDYNPETGVLQWDNRTREVFGLSPDAHVDFSVFLKGVHPDDRAIVEATVKNTFDPENGGGYDIEYRTIGIEDKKLRWIAAKGRAFFDVTGKVYRFIGTVLDITDKKMAAQKLASNEERLREALLVADTGTWKIDLETGMDTRDASLNRILGLEARETTIPVGDSFIRVHHEDEERVKRALEKAVHENGDYNEECRIFRPDGTMRWLRDRGRVITDENKKPLYIIGAAIDITEQKQKEEEIRINEERFRGLFYNASVGMAMASLNGKFIQTNPVFCSMLGYTGEELLQMDVASITHPSFASHNVQLLQQLILGQIDHFSVEKKYITKSGHELWAHSYVSLVKDSEGKPKHLIAVVHDIHDKKLAEESLKLQARVLESMDEGVSVADGNGIILYTNAAEDKMFGYEPGELIGKHVSIQNAYTPKENEKIVASVINELKTSGYWNGEWHNKRKDGSTFYTYSHITSLNLGDRNVLVCVQRDITEEKRTKEALEKSREELERKVDERTKELREANERLERSNAELEQFAYITSHDLQEPLRKIKTFAYRIEDELKAYPNEQVVKYLEKLTNSSDRMSTLIRDLLNYSRLAKQKQQYETIHLNELLNDVMSDFEILMQQKKAEVIWEPLPVIKGIPLQITQLFFNLLGNGLKFSKPGERPVIEIKHRMLNEQERKEMHLPDTDFYEFSFSDNGIGFHPKYKEQVFEIFQRLHSRDQYAGTGIGLALTKKVVENHCGKIVAEPEEGKGTTFKVYLPRDPESV